MDNRNAKKNNPFLKIAAYASCAVLAGCDIELPSLRTATEKVAEYSEQQMPKEPPPPSSSHADGARAELAHFAASRLKIIESDIALAEKDIAEVVEDRRILSARVSELSEKVFSDKTAKRENALLALLKDETLNSLASRYLGGDFSLVRNEFISKVRDAYGRQKLREAALAANKAAFEAEVDGAAGKEARDEKERKSAIRKLQGKMENCERRLRYLRKEIMSSEQARRSRDSEIRDVESEMGDCRRQIARLQSRNGSQSSTVRRQAFARLDAANKETEKKYKGGVSAFEVAEECENATIRKLESLLAMKEGLLRDEKYLLERRRLFISSVSSGIEKLGMNAIAKVRDDIEKALSWSVKDARKSGGNETGR